MIIVTDIDNCIVDDEWRYPHAKEKNWDEYHKAAAMDDSPKTEFLPFVGRKDRLVIITGRPECYREQTLAYFRKYHMRVDELFMRPNGNMLPSPRFKVETAAFEFGAHRISIAFDDRADIVAAYREHGITAMAHAINKRDR